VKATVSIVNERGQELVWHKAWFNFGDTLTIDGIEVREKMTIDGDPPTMETVMWLEGTLTIRIVR